MKRYTLLAALVSVTLCAVPASTGAQGRGGARTSWIRRGRNFRGRSMSPSRASNEKTTAPSRPYRAVTRPLRCPRSMPPSRRRIGTPTIIL